MPLHTRRMITTLALLLSVTSLSWLGWRAQAAATGDQARIAGGHLAARAAATLTVNRTAAGAALTTINVNSTVDADLATLNGNATCDLREAIAAANASGTVGQCAAAPDTSYTINLPAGTITLAGGSGEDANASGDLDLTRAVSYTLVGNASGTIIDGAGGDRHFDVRNAGATLRLEQLTLRNGVARSNGGAIRNDLGGRVELSFAALFNNRAFFVGGAYYSENSAATLVVNNSRFEGNQSAFEGGAIAIYDGRYTITASLFANNRAGDASDLGGALLDRSTTGQTNTISGSTFHSNRTINAGGALGLSGNATVNVTNSTFFGNRVGNDGGAIAVFSPTATLNLSHVTIAGNQARDATGLYVSRATVNISNTIIANNIANNRVGNCFFFSGTVSGTNNLEGAGPSCGSSFTIGNPLLGPLAYNGGPLAGAPGAQIGIPTLLPLPGSAAINVGSNANTLATDQRGVLRPQGSAPDIGAVEVFQDAAMSMIQLTTDPASNPAGAAQELTSAIIFANEDPAATTIQLVCGTYTLTARNNTFYGFTGLPIITTPVTIVGNGAVIERSTAMGTPTFRLFTVAGNGDFNPTTGALLTPGALTLRQVTLRNGLAQGGQGGNASKGAGGGGAGLGGAIYNRGTLVITSTTLTANTAQGGRGGNANIAPIGKGGGGGGLGGNGGISFGTTNGGGGGGGIGGDGGSNNTTQMTTNGGAGGGGTVSNGSGAYYDAGSGGTLNGGTGGYSGVDGGMGGWGGGGGGGGIGGKAGDGGLGGGGGGAGASRSGQGGFGGGGGGGGGFGGGGFGGGGGGGGAGGSNTSGGSGGFGAGTGGHGGSEADTSNGGGGGGLGGGGAIFNDGGTLTLTNSTFSGNAAQGGAAGVGGSNPAQPGQGLGGSIFSRNGTVTINNATLNNNSVTNGAGVMVAGGGGALYLLGDATPVYLDGGQTQERAGDPPGVTFNVTNSIFANSPGGAADAFVNTINVGTATPGTNNSNLVEVNGSNPTLADGNDLPGVTKTADPQLGALTTPNCAASACRTPVHPITTTSPAFNMAGGNAETIDQCGTTRPQGSSSDIGAFELACLTITATVSGDTAIRPGQSATVTVTVTGGTAPYTITLSNNGGTQSGASPLSFTLGPQSTTTYTVTAGNDNNGCPVTASGSAIITVDGTPPTITCPGNQVSVITGTTGPVTYPAPTVNDNRTGATFTCTPASGSNFPLGVRTVNCTATDAAGNTATCSFTVTVRQPRPAIKDLIARVRALAPGTLTTAQANQLIGHLELANTRLERGQTGPTCTHLQNFSNAVNALTTPNGLLTAAQSQSLIEYANQIRAAVGCPS